MILFRRPIKSWSEPTRMTAFSAISIMRRFASSRHRPAIEEIHLLARGEAVECLGLMAGEGIGGTLP